MTSNSTSSFSPQQLLWYKKFFNNISSFLYLNDLVINEFNTFCMNSLNDIPYHSHKSLKCSYSRSFIVYKDNTVTTHSISIPVFTVETVIIIMHFCCRFLITCLQRLGECQRRRVCAIHLDCRLALLMTCDMSLIQRKLPLPF